MKRLHILFCLLLAMACAAASVTADFNPGVTIDRSAEDVILVEIEDSESLHAQAPQLSVPCAFSYAKVTRGDVEIPSTLADGHITFQVNQGGVYRIEKASAPAEEDKTEDTGNNNSRPSGTSSGSSTTDRVQNPDGSVTTTKTDKATGATTETTKTADGTTGTVVTDKNGQITEVSAKVPTAAAQGGATVTLPLELPVSADKGTAPVVQLDVPASGAKVAVPVSGADEGVVAIIVRADGSEEIVKTSVLTENGLTLTVSGDVSVKIVDNSKDFSDVPESYTLAGSIDFVSSRALFGGTSATTFAPHAAATRGQLMTVLARLDGQQANNTAQGMAWAVQTGISDGSNPGSSVTRQQLAVMLWRYAGSPSSSFDLTHSDSGTVADYAEAAVRWCVENGILGGYGDNTLRPTATASRAHLAAFVARYVKAIA